MIYILNNGVEKNIEDVSIRNSVHATQTYGMENYKKKQ